VDNYPGNNPLQTRALLPSEGSGKLRSVVKGRSRMNGLLEDPTNAFGSLCDGIIRSEGKRERERKRESGAEKRKQERIREDNARIFDS